MNNLIVILTMNVFEEWTEKNVFMQNCKQIRAITT